MPFRLARRITSSSVQYISPAAARLCPIPPIINPIITSSTSLGTIEHYMGGSFLLRYIANVQIHRAYPSGLNPSGSAKFMWSGRWEAHSDCNVVYSAAVPCMCSFILCTHTRSPTRDRGTPAPTASITPAPSPCGIIRLTRSLTVSHPDRLLTSAGLTPDV